MSVDRSGKRLSRAKMRRRLRCARVTFRHGASSIGLPIICPEMTGGRDFPSFHGRQTSKRDDGQDMADAGTTVPAGFTRTYWLAGFCIGFALAGFFDGILLHQVLQWHSLLSSLDGAIFEDLRFRMLTDGLFHAVMYVIGAVGLWLLWRSRGQFASFGSGSRFAATLFIGFGVWHLIDAVLNHWILGLHHIRETVSSWLAWDLAFFALGLVCVGIGLFLHRRRPRDGRGTRLGGAAAVLLALAVVGAGTIAASPWTNSQSVTVVFRKGVAPADVLAAMRTVDGRILWSNPGGDVWTFAVENNAAAWRLYGEGALFVSGSFFGMGCFSAAPASTA